jgi:hypothetical protein
MSAKPCFTLLGPELPTFREEAGIPVVHMPSQKPAVAKVIVPLDQLYAVPLSQTQLISTPCDEIVHDQQNRAGRRVCLAPLSGSHVGRVVRRMRASADGSLRMTVVVTCPLSFCTLGDGLAVYHAGATTCPAEGESEVGSAGYKSAVSDVLRAD